MQKKNNTLDRNPCDGYINPYFGVDDHPLLYPIASMYGILYLPTFTVKINQMKVIVQILLLDSNSATLHDIYMMLQNSGDTLGCE